MPLRDRFDDCFDKAGMAGNGRLCREGGQNQVRDQAVPFEDGAGRISKDLV